MNDDIYERSVIVHRQLRGKLTLVGKMPIETQEDLSLAYTPRVARPCELIASDPSLARELTIKRNRVAIVTDGAAVLDLGNIGALAAIPVMEGKALIRVDREVKQHAQEIEQGTSSEDVRLSPQACERIQQKLKSSDL